MPKKSKIRQEVKMKLLNLLLSCLLIIFLISCSHEVKKVPKVPAKAPAKKKIVKTTMKRYAAGCYGEKIYMINDLGLTDDQTARIIQIDEQYAKIYSLHKDRTSRVRAVHKSEIESILTKNQRGRYRVVFKERYKN